MWQPWPEGGPGAAPAAAEQLDRVVVEIRCAQEIYAAGRDLAGRPGQAMRATARRLISDALSLCATNHGDAMTLALAALEAGCGTVLHDRFIDAATRASEAQQRVSVTADAIASVLDIATVVRDALRDRILCGERTARDAPEWAAGEATPPSQVAARADCDVRIETRDLTAVARERTPHDDLLSGPQASVAARAPSDTA